jgi:hypothetical protein
MTYQAYLDNIKAKTGKTPDDFRTLARQKGLTKYPEIMTWLKSEFALGHGHANAIAHEILNADAPRINEDEKISLMFSGGKEKWRKSYDVLIAKLSNFGPDVTVGPTSTYISLKRGANKFGIIQPSAADRLDIGIKLKGAAPDGRFEEAGNWNAMVTHRVRITGPEQIDTELLDWLKKAYVAA